MTSSITFLVDGDEKVLIVCQLDTGSTCNAITYTDLVQLLQDGNPPLNMTKSKLKLFNGTFVRPVGVTTLTVVRRGKYGSCLLWVMSTEISVDIAVDTRSTVGRYSVDTRSILGRRSVDSRSI